MLYRMIGSPTVETHSENLMRLFVRDANGAPVGNAHVKVWAGPPPTGNPPYFNDDLPYRATNPSGMLEYLALAGTMPDTRDYWMQVLDNNGTLLSDPIQFHFPQGSTIWITITAGAGSGTPVEGGTTPPVNVQWDPRLTPMHVSVVPVTGLISGKPYWKIISAQYQDETQSSGTHNLYYTALDERGVPMPGVLIVQDWQGREPNDVPNPVYTDANGTANTGLYAGPVGWNPNAGPGPYSGWVGDPDLRGRNLTGIPGEKIMGLGLPMNRHVNFIVTWRKTFTTGAVANSSIAGTISNAPAGIRVTLSGPVTQTATPDAGGNYAFSNLAAGSYSISIGNVGTIRANIALDGTNTVRVDYTVPAQPPTRPIAHYLLFGPPNVSATRTNLVLALDYVARFAPTVGFSVAEAKNAENVTIVGAGAVSASDEQDLKNAGCTVRHIAGADSYAMEQLFGQLISAGNPYPGA